MMSPDELRELTHILACKTPPAPEPKPEQTLTGRERRIIRAAVRKATRKRWR